MRFAPEKKEQPSEEPARVPRLAFSRTFNPCIHRKPELSQCRPDLHLYKDSQMIRQPVATSHCSYMQKQKARPSFTGSPFVTPISALRPSALGQGKETVGATSATKCLSQPRYQELDGLHPIGSRKRMSYLCPRYLESCRVAPCRRVFSLLEC